MRLNKLKMNTRHELEHALMFHRMIRNFGVRVNRYVIYTQCFLVQVDFTYMVLYIY